MKTIMLFIFSFLSFISYAQETYDYFGSVKINDTTFMSYKLVFSVKNNGVVRGYSITDMGGTHETKSDIFGKYNAQNSTLNFEEKGIVYTKSPVTQDDFCFIHFKSNTFNLVKSKNLKGNFIGKFSDDTECINGKISLVLAEKVLKRTQKITKKIMKVKRISDSVKNKINPLKLLDTLNMNVLRKNQVLSVFTKTKKVNLVIFDSEKEDGDRVSIAINGKVIMHHYAITNQKKVIPIPINSKKTSIKIIAINNGTIPPNTMNVTLTMDGESKIDVISTLRKGEHAQIDVLYKDKK